MLPPTTALRPTQESEAARGSANPDTFSGQYIWQGAIAIKLIRALCCRNTNIYLHLLDDYSYWDGWTPNTNTDTEITVVLFQIILN